MTDHKTGYKHSLALVIITCFNQEVEFVDHQDEGTVCVCFPLVSVKARFFKKNLLFPVQRVAVIVASHFSFGLVGKYCSFFVKKKLFFWKTKKNVPSRPFLTHPAAEPETDFFFSLALWTGHLVTGRGTTKLWGTSEVYPHKKGEGGVKKVVSMLRRGGGTTTFGVA